MQPWIGRDRVSHKDLSEALKVIDLKPELRRKIDGFIDDYAFLGGHLSWNDDTVPDLQECVKAVLAISDKELYSIVNSKSADALRDYVKDKVINMTEEDIEEICYVITKVNK